jgi:hypothetical protein
MFFAVAFSSELFAATAQLLTKAVTKHNNNKDNFTEDFTGKT